MKIPRCPHAWSLTPKQAIAVQKTYAALIELIKPQAELRFIAGLDAAFSSDQRHCIAAVVLWDAKERQRIEQQTAMRKVNFPYIPGLLSFREAPALLAALRKLKHAPDALMCDGQGIAHPRRFGIASHIGLICGLPSIGCAKSRLVGEHDDPSKPRGSIAPLTHHEQVIGQVARTQTGIKPVFVSAGHKIDLDTAVEVVLNCAVKYRLPEPTRLADRLVAAVCRDL